MKVRHVHRIGGIGGSERHLLTLLPALAERGVDVSFLGLDDPARAPDPFYDALTVPYERLSAPRDVDPVLAARVRGAVRDAVLGKAQLAVTPEHAVNVMRGLELAVASSQQRCVLPWSAAA